MAMLCWITVVLMQRLRVPRLEPTPPRPAWSQDDLRYTEWFSLWHGASVDFSTATPTETNKTITVVDDKTVLPIPVTLGTWHILMASPLSILTRLTRAVWWHVHRLHQYSQAQQTGRVRHPEGHSMCRQRLTVTKTAAGTLNRSYHGRSARMSTRRWSRSPRAALTPSTTLLF